jgi:hypothetical protein
MKLKISTANIPAAQAVAISESFTSLTSTGYISAIPELVRPPIPSMASGAGDGGVLDGSDLSALTQDEIESGNLISHDGEIYSWDSARLKLLSLNRKQFLTGREGLNYNMSLELSGVIGSNTGYPLTHECVVTGVAAMISEPTDADCTVEIQAEDGTVLTTVTLPAGDIQIVNINVNALTGPNNKSIKIFTKGAKILNPVAAIELAWVAGSTS